MCLMCSPKDIANFVKAGNATFTLKSKRTAAHYTYRAQVCKDAPGKFFVSLLTGPNNTKDYTYLGMIVADTFRTTKKSRMTADAKPVKALDFLLRHVVVASQEPTKLDLEVYHEGRCGRCNRLLTVPESVERGIGPDCAEQMGL